MLTKTRLELTKFKIEPKLMNISVKRLKVNQNQVQKLTLD